jgi:hypothetical protein
MGKILLVLVALAVSTHSQGQSQIGSALRRLTAIASDAKWDSVAVRADFDCDGRTDEAHLAHRPGEVLVGVVRAAGGEPQILTFAVNASMQRSICAEPAHLTIERLTGRPPGDVGPIRGYPLSRRCAGLMLSGGECDNVHLYWNTENHRFEWWRR